MEVSDQIIIAEGGFIVALNGDMVCKMMNMMEIKNSLDCYRRVMILARKIHAARNEELKHEDVKGSVGDLYNG